MGYIDPFRGFFLIQCEIHFAAFFLCIYSILRDRRGASACWISNQTLDVSTISVAGSQPSIKQFEQADEAFVAVPPAFFQPRLWLGPVRGENSTVHTQEREHG